MKIFLDANILVSVVNKEYPLFGYSSRLVSLADDSRFSVYTSPVCLAIAFYFSEKKSGRQRAKEKIRILANKIEIAGIDNAVVVKASNDKTISDYEEGLEYYSAVQAGCKCIITEDLDDLYFSKIEVLNSHQFLEKYLR